MDRLHIFLFFASLGYDFSFTLYTSTTATLYTIRNTCQIVNIIQEHLQYKCLYSFHSIHTHLTLFRIITLFIQVLGSVFISFYIIIIIKIMIIIWQMYLFHIFQFMMKISGSNIELNKKKMKKESDNNDKCMLCGRKKK